MAKEFESAHRDLISGHEELNVETLRYLKDIKSAQHLLTSADKTILARSLLTFILTNPESHLNLLLSETFWRADLYESFDENILADSVFENGFNHDSEDRPDGIFFRLDHGTQSNLLRTVALKPAPSRPLVRAMAAAFRHDPVGKPCLALVSILAKNGREADVQKRFEHSEFAVRIQKSLLRLSKEFKRRHENSSEQLAEDQFYLSALQRTETLLKKALGAAGSPESLNPPPDGFVVFRCVACGRSKRVANGETDGRMKVRCTMCGSTMSAPPQTE